MQHPDNLVDIEGANFQNPEVLLEARNAYLNELGGIFDEVNAGFQATIAADPSLVPLLSKDRDYTGVSREFWFDETAAHVDAEALFSVPVTRLEGGVEININAKVEKSTHFTRDRVVRNKPRIVALTEVLTTGTFRRQKVHSAPIEGAWTFGSQSDRDQADQEVMEAQSAMAALLGLDPISHLEYLKRVADKAKGKEFWNRNSLYYGKVPPFKGLPKFPNRR